MFYYGFINDQSICTGTYGFPTEVTIPNYIYIGTTDDKTVIGKYLPMLKQMGIVDESNKVDIEVAKGFINSAFDKSGTVEYLGFKFDKSDGEALINIMEKYKDD